MTSKRNLARQLSSIAGFDHPRVDLEQYKTPPDIAAHVIHVAALRGDIADRTVIDLGTGTGMFAIGAVLRGATPVVGLEIDPDALDIARTNTSAVGISGELHWIRGDVFDHPLRSVAGATVIMNPPFGAQRDNRHADRQFLAVAREIGAVSYSIHNAGSMDFVEAYAADEGGTVTDAFELTMPLPNQFDFHTAADRTISAECFRIEWDDRRIDATGSTPR